MMNRTDLISRQLRSALSLIVAALMIGSISYLGIHTFKASHAAVGASLYVSPDSATVTSGSTVSITIREDSGVDALNSVQASLNYDANKLQYVSLTEGGSFPIVAATSTGTAGVIRVGRANSDTSVSGDHPIVTINFKVIGTSGTAAISFDKAFSSLVRSSDSHDVLQNVGSGSYTIGSAAGGGTAPTTRPVMYLNPAGGAYTTSSTIAVAVRLNSYNTAVTTVEAAIGYPTSQLQYVGVTEAGPYTTKQRTNATNGVVDLIRAIPGGSSGISNDNPVVTINFKVIGSAPAAAVTIAAASAAFDGSGTGQSVLNLSSSTGATYALSAPATVSGGTTPTPSPVPDPMPVSYGNNDFGVADAYITSPSQALTAGAKGSNSSVALTTDASGAVLTQLAGDVSLSPIIDPSIFAKNPNDTVSKVEYYVDGKLLSTQKSAPFSYKFDTNSKRNGTYTMVVKTYFSGGTVDTRTDKLLVKNKVTLAYVMRHFLANILGVIAILVVLAAIMWKLAIPRFGAHKQVVAVTDHDALYGFTPASHGPAAPVAGDPTVVTPDTGMSPAAPSLDGPSLSATQTTQALPWAPATTVSTAIPTSQAAQISHAAPLAPAQLITPTQPRPIAVSGPTFRPDVAAPAPRPVTVVTNPVAPAAPLAAPTTQIIRSNGVVPPTNRF